MDGVRSGWVHLQVGRIGSSQLKATHVHCPTLLPYVHGIIMSDMIGPNLPAGSGRPTIHVLRAYDVR